MSHSLLFKARQQGTGLEAEKGDLSLNPQRHPSLHPFWKPAHGTRSSSQTSQHSAHSLIALKLNAQLFITASDSARQSLGKTTHLPRGLANPQQGRAEGQTLQGGVQVPAAQLPNSAPCPYPWESRRRWPRYWALANHMEDPDGLPDSWFQTSLVLAVAVTWAVNQQMKELTQKMIHGPHYRDL